MSLDITLTATIDSIEREERGSFWTVARPRWQEGPHYAPCAIGPLPGASGPFARSFSQAEPVRIAFGTEEYDAAIADAECERDMAAAHIRDLDAEIKAAHDALTARGYPTEDNGETLTLAGRIARPPCDSGNGGKAAPFEYPGMCILCQPGGNMRCGHVRGTPVHSVDGKLAGHAAQIDPKGVGVKLADDALAGAKRVMAMGYADASLLDAGAYGNLSRAVRDAVVDASPAVSKRLRDAWARFEQGGYDEWGPVGNEWTDAHAFLDGQSIQRTFVTGNGETLTLRHRIVLFGQETHGKALSKYADKTLAADAAHAFLDERKVAAGPLVERIRAYAIGVHEDTVAEIRATHELTIPQRRPRVGPWVDVSEGKGQSFSVYDERGHQVAWCNSYMRGDATLWNWGAHAPFASVKMGSDLSSAKDAQGAATAVLREWAEVAP